MITIYSLTTVFRIVNVETLRSPGVILKESPPTEEELDN